MAAPKGWLHNSEHVVRRVVLNVCSICLNRVCMQQLQLSQFGCSNCGLTNTNKACLVSHDEVYTTVPFCAHSKVCSSLLSGTWRAFVSEALIVWPGWPS